MPEIHYYVADMLINQQTKKNKSSSGPIKNRQTFCINKHVAVKFVPEREDVLSILEVDISSGEGIHSQAAQQT